MKPFLFLSNIITFIYHEKHIINYTKTHCKYLGDVRMITKYDERVYIESKYTEEFKEVTIKVLNHMREHFMEYKEERASLGYSNEFRARNIAKIFDSLIMEHGFELDGRTLTHAHGIGNNNEWEIVDKNLNPVGNFYATDNMYCGVILGVTIKGEKIDGFEMCSGGFIRED